MIVLRPPRDLHRHSDGSLPLFPIPSLMTYVWFRFVTEGMASVQKERVERRSDGEDPTIETCWQQREKEKATRKDTGRIRRVRTGGQRL